APSSSPAGSEGGTFQHFLIRPKSSAACLYYAAELHIECLSKLAISMLIELFHLHIYGIPAGYWLRLEGALSDFLRVKDISKLKLSTLLTQKVSMHRIALWGYTCLLHPSPRISFLAFWSFCEHSARHPKKKHLLMDTQNENITGESKVKGKDAFSTAREEEDEETDEDGPIEREIDVYINRVDDATISLLQYPLRPVYRPYGDQGQLTKVEFRKQQRTLQMTYNLNIAGENFDDSQHIQFPGDVAALRESQAAQVSRHQLKSQQAISPHCSYGVGILRDGNLYITPITSLLQFRPNFQKVDAERLLTQQKATEKLRESSERLAASDASMVSMDEMVSGATLPPGNASLTSSSFVNIPLKTEREDQTLKSTGHPSFELTTHRGYEKEASLSGVAGAVISPPTFAYSSSLLEKRSRIPHSRLRDAEEEEPWIPIDTFYDSDSPEAYEIINVLCSMKKIKGNQVSKIISTEDVITLDVSNEEEDVIPDVKFVEDFSSYMNCLCSTQERIIPGSSPAHASTTNSLNYLFLSKLPMDQQVLEILKQRHVETFDKIKNHLTRPWPDKILLKTLENIATLIMGNWVIKSHYVYDGYQMLCRDFILGLLIRQEGKPGIPREPLKLATCLPLDILNHLLMEIGECHSAGWQFKLQRDVQFCKNYPEEVARSEAYWKERMIFIVREIQQRREEFLKGNKNAFLSKSNGLSKSLTKECETLLQRSVLTVEELKQNLEQLHSEESTEFLTKEKLATALTSFAIEIGPVWALKKLGDEQVDKYRDILISLFRSYQQPLTKAVILEEFEKVLDHKFELPDFTFRKLMREFAVNEAGRWVFKGSLITSSSPLKMERL
ncbi:Dna-directed Rna polymerase III RPC5, partial [Cardiosporidium cionae]